VDRFEESRQRSLAHGLRHGRVGVAGAGKIFRRTAELHQHRDLVDHLARAEADDVTAEHPSVALSARIFTKPSVCSMARARPLAVKGNFPALYYAGLLQLLLGLADGRDFGAGVNDARDDVIVHMAMLTGDDLGYRDAFVLGLVRQHRPGDDIANGVDAWHIGAVLVISLDFTAVGLDAKNIQAQAIRVGARPVAISTTSASMVSAAPPLTGSKVTLRPSWPWPRRSPWNRA
jgi:hypothetical protein